MTNWDYIISKKYKDQIYKMIFEKKLALHGGVIGEYDENHFVVTLLPDWVKYLEEYNIDEFKHRSQQDYEDYINMRGKYKNDIH